MTPTYESWSKEDPVALLKQLEMTKKDVTNGLASTAVSKRRKTCVVVLVLLCRCYTSMASYHSTIDQYRHHESLYITIKFDPSRPWELFSMKTKVVVLVKDVKVSPCQGKSIHSLMTSIGQYLIFASLLFFLLLYPSLGVDVVGAGTGAGALNSALFPPAPPPPNYFRIFDHLASLFSDSHFLLSDPLLLAPFPPLPSRIFAIFTICSLASSSFISLHVL
ncbi:uncharacterized protein EDB91DRAFT_1339111 [Suillus paluster]|uniref:uncharacterized protein n=1 Tax=Suillus paluster TaxID=48578 RepID=UPI001B86961F|nr:uncharacterized protein EDB91DRAFT_1339111 [Suillus paluster]KAG1728949.1 hypothetical protein EDB91DRAFT_1339111 [Suillus paluster]